MLTKIKKRDGRIVIFNQQKITNAIFKAAQSVGGDDMPLAVHNSNDVLDILKARFNADVPTVEDIQDVVEEVLIKNGHAKTAKAYILYRDLHRKLRDVRALIDANELINGYLDRTDWQVQENANMGYSLQGLNNHIFTEVNRTYWLNSLYPREARDAHINGDLHIHDLYLPAVYCAGWDLEDLLIMGFGGAVGKLECAPAKHFSSALGQIVNFLYTTQGEVAGAVAFSNFDTLLAPFISFDHLNKREVKQHLQEFLFNCNVPTRVGFQTPFTNITLDFTVPEHLKKQNIIIGGESYDEFYGDFQTEVDLFNECLLEVMLEGDAKGKPFTFPIPTVNITKDFDWNNPRYTSLWEITRKYGIPYFANFINSDMCPDDVRSMCCRLRLDITELMRRAGGLFGSAPSTGSIGIVTLNLARIGYLTKSKGEFLYRVGELMDIAKDSLLTKRKIVEQFTEQGLYPYSKHYLAYTKERFGGWWSGHFNTIGLCGMNEATLNLLKEDLTSAEARSFSKEVLEFMNQKLLEYQSETGQLFNLEATPAESTAYRFALLDKAAYPDIITAGENEPYYTNSTQLPVNATDDLFEALEWQDETLPLYTGGSVFHAFLGEQMPSVIAVKSLVQKIATKFRLPYFTITPTFSICPDHGYLSGEHPVCPHCDKPALVYSRVVGYLRPVTEWNPGKASEYRDREVFKV